MAAYAMCCVGRVVYEACVAYQETCQRVARLPVEDRRQLGSLAAEVDSNYDTVQRTIVQVC
jgi:hypothetical protein